MGNAIERASSRMRKRAFLIRARLALAVVAAPPELGIESS